MEKRHIRGTASGKISRVGCSVHVNEASQAVRVLIAHSCQLFTSHGVTYQNWLCNFKGIHNRKNIVRKALLRVTGDGRL